MKNTLILFCCLWAYSYLAAQTNCPYYQKYITQGDAELKKGNKANFEIAINAYSTAMEHCPEKAAAARAKILEAFKAIERLKASAESAEKAAKKAEAKAQTEADNARKAKIQADTSAAQAKRAKANTQAALQKAQKLIDAFYFYDNKFALAYGNIDFKNVFYFIDKNGDEVTKLRQWTKADQFDDRGFAKVEREDVYGSTIENFLLDTLGNTYRVAYKIEDLSPSITALDLSGQELNSLSEQVGQNTQLKILLLNTNQLSTLPESIGKLSNLQMLDLRDNRLSTLPESITQLSNLQALGLVENQLTTLPESIGKLSNLQTLYLNTNQLSTLPESIGKLSNLQMLDLRDNRLSTLPESITQLSNLQTLGLVENQLTTLPESIGKLSNLQTLYLNTNQLSTLPESIGKLSNLRELGLGENDALFPYDKWLEDEELKPFLTKLSKGAIKFEGYEGFYNAKKEEIKQDSTNSDNWFSLSFYALLVNKPQVAIQSAQKTLALDSTQVSVEANLALGYLLNNQYPQAEAIYLKWKDKSFPDDERNCNDVFLQDIADLEAADITHPDFEKVKQLLKEQ